MKELALIATFHGVIHSATEDDIWDYISNLPLYLHCLAQVGREEPLIELLEVPINEGIALATASISDVHEQHDSIDARRAELDALLKKLEADRVTNEADRKTLNQQSADLERRDAATTDRARRLDSRWQQFDAERVAFLTLTRRLTLPKPPVLGLLFSFLFVIGFSISAVMYSAAWTELSSTTSAASEQSERRRSALDTHEQVSRLSWKWRTAFRR